MNKTKWFYDSFHEKPHQDDTLSRENAYDKIKSYGFTEIGDLITFLQVICNTNLDISELIYFRSKIDVCLRHHDDSSDYFIPLREFASELDCLINVKQNIK